MTVTALIVAAGRGERAGGGIPKQFQTIGGTALVAHAVDSFARHAAVDHVVIIHAPGQQEMVQEALNGRTVADLLPGGEERLDSVRAGLDMLTSQTNTKIVLIHDAARPFIPEMVIDALLRALETSDGAVPVLPVVDTLARGDELLGAVVDRNGLYRVQTPQAFHLDAIMTSHLRWSGGPATDDAQMARAAGFDVRTVTGSAELEKVTLKGDIARIEAMRKANMISRTGMGFDVHRLEAGQDLWLCGVQIPFEKGLAGHSDADVALHALTDALLGAIAAGDIGSHFPPSEVKWKGAPSSLFVEHARDLILQRGGVIDHVDLTLICEMPKIGPHRDTMRQQVAALLQVQVAQVSIKATTTEKLGFAGRGEGIAAQAVATVRTME